MTRPSGTMSPTRARLLLSVLVPVHHLTVIASAACAVAWLAGPLRGPDPVARWIRIGFAVVILTSAASLLVHRRCFLTTWENRLRQRAGTESTYSTPFLEHHLRRWPGPLRWTVVYLVRYGMPLLVPVALWIMLTDLGPFG